MIRLLPSAISGTSIGKPDGYLSPQYFSHDEDQDCPTKPTAKKQIQQRETDRGNRKNVNHWTPRQARSATRREIPQAKHNCAKPSQVQFADRDETPGP
jgi:hypothetical protein